MEILSFKTNKESEFITLTGFDNFENWGCWSCDFFSTITIDKSTIDNNRVKFVRLRFSAFTQKDTSLDFSLNTTWGYSENFQLKPEVGIIAIDIPIIKSSTYLIAFNFKELISPSATGISDDDRLLGIGLREVLLLSNPADLGYKSNQIFEIQHSELSKKSNDIAIKSFQNKILNSPNILADAISNHILKNKFLDLKKIKSLIESICILKNIPSGSALDFINSISTLYLEKSDDVLSRNESKSIFPSNICIVGGFFYSGSSAVYDYLKSLDNVVTMSKSDVEFRILSSFYEILNNTNTLSSINFFFKELFSSYLPTNTYEANSLSEDFSIMERAILSKDEIILKNYSSSVLEFSGSINSSDIQQKRKAFTRFIANCANIQNSSNFKLLLNQCPIAVDLKPLSCFEDGVNYIAVTRDPRDQYIDQLNSKTIHYNDVHEFISSFLRNWENYIIEKSKMPHFNFLEVGFEDFVLNKSTRELIAEKIGLSTIGNNSGFQQDESILNIGKFLKVKDKKLQSDFEIIKSRLYEFCWADNISRD